jgi:Na+-transporting NADH:ubiquinone oxidoreductase subunit E
MEFLNTFIKAAFIENLVLAYFLGMCSYLAVSKSVKTAFGLGLAVIFVLGITMPINWLINEFLLSEAGIFGIDLTFLRFILFIAVIASMVQLVEMVVENIHPHCIVLGNFPSTDHGELCYPGGISVSWFLGNTTWANS